jgi:hypothetical protein
MDVVFGGSACDVSNFVTGSVLGVDGGSALW